MQQKEVLANDFNLDLNMNMHYNNTREKIF